MGNKPQSHTYPKSLNITSQNFNEKKLQTEIESNFKKISTNTEKIHQNSGALEILRGFKAICLTIFVIWLFTFIALLFFIFN